ncbi:MAG: pilus assembly protein PilO [Nostocaceae cyanobacterium]|nr:pilus assembly protein PilO [Nostocaceae cyanobacterium]
MTVSEDFNFTDQGGEFEEQNYPVVFGVTFTPKIGGIVAGVLGIAGGLWMVLNMVMPAWKTFGEQQSKANDLRTQIEEKKSSIKSIDKVKAELAEAKKQQIQVLSVFANEKTLDTLLLDLNRLIESGNVKLGANDERAKLRRFVPQSEKPEVINDGYFGELVNGKLKRSSINVDIVGTYEQIQSILRNIERLQPLLIVKDYQSQLAPTPVITDEAGNQIPKLGPAQINTSFELQALMPLNTEEVEALAKAEKDKKSAKKK